MAKFKQIPQTFLFDKLLGFWHNVVRNYRNDVTDNDFFDVVRNCFDHDKGIDLVETAFSKKEIEEMQNAHLRRQRLDFEDSLDCVFQNIWNNERMRDKCRVVLDGIYDYMAAENAESGDAGEDVLGKRFREMQRLLKLTDLELEILILAYVCNQTCFSWPCHVHDRDKPMYYAMALDRSYAEVTKAMTANGTLRKFNLLDNDWDFNLRALGSYIDGTDAEALERRFYKKCGEKEVLPWEFYGELAEKDGAVIKDIVKAASGKCNILLYGAPGTGKTSFAKSLARELGLTAFEIKQGDDDGRNQKSEARMMGIRICNDQEDAKKSLMIVDEADELLRGSSCSFGLFGFETGGKSTEKGVMNSILDEMKLPAVWISNAPAESMDESVRRRFDYSVCFERMNTVQRVSIWRNLVKKHRLERLIPDSKIAGYSAKYETSAGGISIVLANVKRMKPAADKVDELVAKLMKPHCRLMGIAADDKFLPAKGYSLEGLNVKGKVKPERIVRAVRNYLDAGFNAAAEDRPRMNVLMYGAPGTGKTEFVKFLGKELDRKVLVMKGSDILSKWVGGTEQRLAEAFRRAEAEHAILFFDEIDGIVQSRDRAQASWEVSQVNELLQQMENFDGVMIAATNFSKNLDPAIMRRFTFKLEFDYLDDEGKKTFFEKMFGTKLTEVEFEELKTLKNLAPGDFRTVRQELFYLADEQTNSDRISALREECKAKKDGDRPATGPIGFAA